MTDETTDSVEVENQEVDDGLLNADSETEEVNLDAKPEEKQEVKEGEEKSTDETGEYTDFSIPEGMELDAELLARANPIFKDIGLSQEQAQKLVDFQAETVQKQTEEYQQRVEGWKESATNDKEYGGDNLKENLAIAWKAVETYFDPSFIEDIKPFGLNNHPELIRGLYKIAKAHLVEDNPTGGRAVNQGQSRAERFYGKK